MSAVDDWGRAMNEGKRIDYVMLDPRKPVAQRDRRRLLKGFAALLFFSFLVGSVFRSIRSVSNSTEHSKLISLLTNQNWYCSAEDEGSKISTLEKYDSEKTFHGLALYVDTGSGSILLKAHYNGQYELSDLARSDLQLYSGYVRSGSLRFRVSSAIGQINVVTDSSFDNRRTD